MRKHLVKAMILCLLLPLLCSCHTPENPTSPSESAEQQTEQISESVDDTPMQEISYYQNPVLTAAFKDAWQGYGFGDPFVMRHNGQYYLYVSTKDGQVGVKCWVSDDLVNWTYAGLCATDQRTRGAYAPEVYYYNGYFYMYTSPAGQGHYVLRSNSPTEGFEVVTDNMGMSIDGSVFIDHDGKWYFYTANHGRMMVYDMTSPTAMRKGRELPAISVNGAWTEGPMTVWHDGYYYMTYTGNHVLGRSYRINYGASATSPLHFEGTEVKNPLLIHTMGNLFGIGHSSTVKGPDLDSYYIVYHSLVNPTPQRNTHVDRIVFNGTSMQIMGPSEGKVQVPEMPDIYHRFGAGESLQGWTLTGDFGTQGTGLPLAADAQIVSCDVLKGDFTAEYHVTYVQSGAQAGALFAYTDAENFGACYFLPDEQQLCIEITANGKTAVQKVNLVKSFGEDVRFDCLQALQIERCGNTYTFYVNDRPAYTLQSDALGDGGIGYVTRGGEASFGFIGGTAAVGGRGAADTYHSVGAYSGLIPVTHYTFGSYRTEQIEGVYAVHAPAGSVLNYRVLAQQDGAYDVKIRYAAEQDAEIEIYVDGERVNTLSLAASQTLTSAVCRAIPMADGQHTLSFKVIRGSVDVVEYHVLLGAEVSSKIWNFDKNSGSYAYTDGIWEAAGTLHTSRSPLCAKRLFGQENWGDYSVSVKVTPQSGVNCGLLVRAANPGASNFMHQSCTDEDAAVGTDWLQGYFVGLTADGVVLGKQNYSYTELARTSGSFATGNTYTLKVECQGAVIRVYVDGTLQLEYTDADPFMQGMIGVRTYRCAAAFDDLRIDPIE